MKSTIQKITGILSKNVSIADYRKYLSEKYGKVGAKDHLKQRSERTSKARHPNTKVSTFPPFDNDSL